MYCSYQFIVFFSYVLERCSMQEIGWGYRSWITTTHKIIKDVCRILWDVLFPTELPTLTVNILSTISEAFLKRCNMSNCIGAVDGKHIIIKSRPMPASEFFNYEQSFSVILISSCDAYYSFTMVDIGAVGETTIQIFLN